MISENIYLITFLPLWIFLIIMLGRFVSVYVNKYVIYTAALLSSFIGAAASGVLYVLIGADKIYEAQIPFIKINDYIITCGIHIDRLSLIFAGVLFIVSFLVQLFSISYMKDEDKQYKFYALINLFNFSLAGMFFSPNLFQIYVFWELAGIVSYLLIGFDYFKSEKSLASRKVFIINRIGDTALIGAIIMSSYYMYEYAPSKSLPTLSLIDFNTISTLLSVYSSESVYFVICALFIIAAMVKSAQFPFYTWLQDAMEAKLPVSALLHSATLVASGIYLLLRLTDLFVSDTILLKIIIAVGIITAIACSLSACVQTNPKKVLAYSTSAQLGLVVMAIGMLNIKAAVLFFIAHAFIKSMLFLSLPKDNKKWNYINFVIFLIGGLSLSGVLFAGMIVKEMMAYGLGNNLKIIFCLISFLTAFYIIRIALVVADKKELGKSKANVLETVSTIMLLVFNVILYVYIRRFGNYQIAAPFWFAIFAWISVYILYIKQGFKRIFGLYELCMNGFYLDKFYTNIVVNIYEKISRICLITEERFFSNYGIIKRTSSELVKTFEWIEENIMNNTVNIVSGALRNLSVTDNKAQKGNIQYYNLYAFIIVTIIIVCLIMSYTAIVSHMGGFE